MAKLIGPLCSFAATGTIAGMLEVRNLPTGQTAQRYAKATTPPTDAQLAARQRAAWAADAWRYTPEKERDQWRAAATAARLPVFGLYMREFMIQNCGLGQSPLIPEVTP